jgi:transposase
VPGPTGDEHRDLCREAFSLRASGMLLRDIALMQEVSEQAICDRLKWWRENAPEEATDSVEYRRRLSVERMDQIRSVLRDRVAQGDEKAIELMLRLDDRESKLLGLDAPTQSVVKGETRNYMIDGVHPEDLR